MKRITSCIFVLLFFGLLGLTTAQEENFITTEDGAQIYYQVQGEGEPMVLVHGYPLNSGLFRDNVGPLSAQFQVVTVDLRGFGQSISPNQEGSVETYASDVLAVMDELGIEQAIIGGMSMGGPTVFSMYQMAPERFRGLILIDTIAAAAAPAEAGLWNGAAEMAQSMGVASLVPVLMKDMLTGDTRMNQPDLVEYLSSLMQQASLEGAVGGAHALANRPDFTDLLPQIEVPALILIGLEDTVYPFEISQMMQQGIAGSQLVVIPGASHAAIIEAADEANQAILEWAQGIE